MGQRLAYTRPPLNICCKKLNLMQGRFRNISYSSKTLSFCLLYSTCSFVFIYSLKSKNKFLMNYLTWIFEPQNTREKRTCERSTWIVWLKLEQLMDNLKELHTDIFYTSTFRDIHFEGASVTCAPLSFFSVSVLYSLSCASHI